VKKFTIISADLMIPVTYSRSAQLFKLYSKHSSMCSYNLDHYDHVRFRRENEEVLIEH